MSGGLHLGVNDVLVMHNQAVESKSDGLYGPGGASLRQCRSDPVKHTFSV